MINKPDYNKEAFEYISSRIEEYNKSRPFISRLFGLDRATYTELENSYDELIWTIESHGTYKYKVYRQYPNTGVMIPNSEKNLSHPILRATNKVTGEVHIITEIPNRGKCRLFKGPEKDDNYIYNGRQLFDSLI